MSKRIFTGLALLIAVLLAASAFAGCMAHRPDDNIDLPVVTDEPQDLPVITDGPDETEPAADDTEAPTEAVTEAPTAAPTAEPTAAPTQCPVSEEGKYDTKDEVALYIHLFGHLPSNYIKKNDAKALGWTGGGLDAYAPGCSIGGDYFGNYEGLLPAKQGRKYTECDIGTKGKNSRGAKRIIFSNDGLIYYTDDHYESFTLLYGED